MERAPLQPGFNDFPDTITRNVSVVNETTGVALGSMDIDVAMPDEALSATSTEAALVAAVRGAHAEATTVHVDKGLVLGYNEEARSYLMGGPVDGDELSPDEAAILASYETDAVYDEAGLDLAPQTDEGAEVAANGVVDSENYVVTAAFDEEEPTDLGFLPAPDRITAENAEDGLSLWDDFDKSAGDGVEAASDNEFASPILGDLVAISLLDSALPPKSQSDEEQPGFIESLMIDIENGIRPDNVTDSELAENNQAPASISPILGSEAMLSTPSLFGPDLVEPLDAGNQTITELGTEIPEVIIDTLIADKDAAGNTFRPPQTPDQILVPVNIPIAEGSLDLAPPALRSPILGNEVFLGTATATDPDRVDPAEENPLTIDQILGTEMSEAAFDAILTDMDSAGDTIRAAQTPNQILVEAVVGEPA